MRALPGEEKEVMFEGRLSRKNRKKEKAGERVGEKGNFQLR